MTLSPDAKNLIDQFKPYAKDRDSPFSVTDHAVRHFATQIAIKHCELMLTELGKLTDGNIDATLSYHYYANLLDELKSI